MFFDPITEMVEEVAEAYETLAIRTLGTLDQMGALDTYHNDVRPNMVAAATSATLSVFEKAGKISKEDALALGEGIALITQILADNEAELAEF
jgi:hypothetical protein